MEDWEKRNFLDRQNQEISRQNDLLEEKNRLAKEQNEALRQSNLDAKWREEQYRREQREIEDIKRIERFEKDMDDRIYKLKLDIAKTKDETIRYALQGILDEEIQKRNKYYQEREAHQLEKRRQVRRYKTISLIKNIIFTVLGLTILFAILTVYLSSSNNDSARESFGTKLAMSGTVKKDIDEDSNLSTSVSSKTNKEVRHSIKQENEKSSSLVSERLQVDVTADDISIRESASLSAKVVGVCPKGVYTIVETTSGDGYTWGRLKSGKGWIALDSTEKMNSESITEGSDTSAEWERPYHNYYVASSSSTLMMAGFKLESNGKVTLYRSGAEILLANSGNPVEGRYTIESYNSTEQVTSFEITQRTIVNGDIPNTKKILPNVIIRIYVSAEELQKAGESVSEEHNLIYYGYYSYLGQHILTDGNSSATPQVFFQVGE
ncbi:hypothetical protein [Streptococcus henryi]|uniref:hypothetical protein n=1 Tax=Streptococcus henryi TaxID=439219 RepID=UPI00036A62C1|nr:hypothetical protein [Streptococcus henryi]